MSVDIERKVIFQRKDEPVNVDTTVVCGAHTVTVYLDDMGKFSITETRAASHFDDERMDIITLDDEILDAIFAARGRPR